MVNPAVMEQGEHEAQKMSAAQRARQDPAVTFFECEPIGLGFFETATQRYVFTQEIPVGPERLFEIFADAASWPVFAAPGILKVEWTTPQPYGVGTERTVHLAGGLQVFERFIAWESGKHMAFCFVGATQKVWWRFGENYRVTDLGGGRCELEWTVAYDPRHIFKILHPLIRPIQGTFLGRKVLGGLAEYCARNP